MEIVNKKRPFREVLTRTENYKTLSAVEIAEDYKEIKSLNNINCNICYSDAIKDLSKEKRNEIKKLLQEMNLNVDKDFEELYNKDKNNAANTNFSNQTK